MPDNSCYILTESGEYILLENGDKLVYECHPAYVYAGAASGSGTAYSASCSVLSNAQLAAGSGSSEEPTETDSPNATSAVGVGVAYDAIINIGAQSSIAQSNGSAFLVSASIFFNAGFVSGSGTASNATASISTGASIAEAQGQSYDVGIVLNVFSQSAVGVGLGYDTSVNCSVTPGLASGTGAANAPNTIVLSRGLEASNGVGASYQAFGAVNVTTQFTTGTGATIDSATIVATNTNQASGSGSSNNSSNTIQVGSDSSSGTGSAYSASVLTTSITSALAEPAQGNANATDANVAILPTASLAIGTGASENAATAVSTSASAAVGSGFTQSQPSGAPNVDTAYGAGSSHNPSSLNFASGTQVAFGVGVSFSAKTIIETSAGTAEAQGAAHSATISIVAYSTQASGFASAFDITSSNIINATPSNGTGDSQTPRINVSVNSQEASAEATSYATTVALNANADCAFGSGSLQSPHCSVAVQAQTATGISSVFEEIPTEDVYSGVSVGGANAFNAAVLIIQPVYPSLAQGTGSALHPKPTVAISVEQVLGQGNAYSQVGQVNAAATTATANSVELKHWANVAPSAGLATGSGTSEPLGVSTSANPLTIFVRSVIGIAAVKASKYSSSMVIESLNGILETDISVSPNSNNSNNMDVQSYNSKIQIDQRKQSLQKENRDNTFDIS